MMRTDPQLLEPRLWARRLTVVLMLPCAVAASVIDRLARDIPHAFWMAWNDARLDIDRARDWWRR